MTTMGMSDIRKTMMGLEDQPLDGDLQQRRIRVAISDIAVAVEELQRMHGVDDPTGGAGPLPPIAHPPVPLDDGDRAETGAPDDDDRLRPVSIHVDPGLREMTLEIAAACKMSHTTWSKRWLLHLAEAGVRLPRTLLGKSHKAGREPGGMVSLQVTAQENDLLEAAGAEAGLPKGAWCRDALQHAVHRSVTADGYTAPPGG